MEEETYRLSPKIKILWAMEYIIGIFVLWIILSVIYSVFFPDLKFLLLIPELPVVSYLFILFVLILFIGIPAYVWVKILYKNFTYTMGENEVLIRTGIIHKKRIDIPYTSIENVSVEKHLYERIFGLGTVVIDTAGGDSKEGLIPGVADTESVIKELLNRMKIAKGNSEKKDPKGNEETLPILKDILTELKSIKDALKQKKSEKNKKVNNLMDIKEFEKILAEQASKKKTKNSKKR
ncbi:MAG: PH domain-containing protein [Candidatus Micrarchaeia archaeon]|jgi:putative membrane protein